MDSTTDEQLPHPAAHADNEQPPAEGSQRDLGPFSSYPDISTQSLTFETPYNDPLGEEWSNYLSSIGQVVAANDTIDPALLQHVETADECWSYQSVQPEPWIWQAPQSTTFSEWFPLPGESINQGTSNLLGQSFPFEQDVPNNSQTWTQLQTFDGHNHSFSPLFTGEQENDTQISVNSEPDVPYNVLGGVQHDGNRHEISHPAPEQETMMQQFQSTLTTRPRSKRKTQRQTSSTTPTLQPLRSKTPGPVSGSKAPPVAKVTQIRSVPAPFCNKFSVNKRQGPKASARAAPRSTKVCARCQDMKKACSGEWPCTECTKVLSNAVAKRSGQTLKFTACFDSDISELDIFQTSLVLLIFADIDMNIERVTDLIPAEARLRVFINTLRVLAGVVHIDAKMTGEFKPLEFSPELLLVILWQGHLFTSLMGISKAFVSLLAYVTARGILKSLKRDIAKAVREKLSSRERERLCEEMELLFGMMITFSPAAFATSDAMDLFAHLGLYIQHYLSKLRPRANRILSLDLLRGYLDAINKMDDGLPQVLSETQAERYFKTRNMVEGDSLGSKSWKKQWQTGREAMRNPRNGESAKRFASSFLAMVAMAWHPEIH